MTNILDIMSKSNDWVAEIKLCGYQDPQSHLSPGEYIVTKIR